MTIDRASGIFFVFLGLFVIWERRVLPLGTPGNPGPGYFPLLLAILLILLGGILVIRGKEAVALRSVKWPEVRTAMAILGCCIFATLAMETIGYRVTMVLILGFLFGFLERLKIWQVLALTLSLALGSFWLFDTFLRVPLPRGGFGF
jgi:putative tricarboxylic transport membrane protein